MKKKLIGSLLLCGNVVISSFASDNKAAEEKPNIIVILADDLG